MPKRRRRIDPRWERAESGLFLPRRAPLPSLRFLPFRKNNPGTPCCETCGIWSTARPSTVNLSVTGVANDYCSNCGDANGDWEVPFVSRSSTTYPCQDTFSDEFDSGNIYAFVLFKRWNATDWSISAGVWDRTNTCTCSGGAPYYFAWVGSIYYIYSAFQSGQTYNSFSIYTTDLPSGCSDYMCDVSGASFEVTT